MVSAENLTNFRLHFINARRKSILVGNSPRLNRTGTKPAIHGYCH